MQVRNVAIVAAGVTRFGARQASYRDLISEAGKACFDNNKNINRKDIDGFILSTVIPERCAFQGHAAPLAAEVLGVRPERLFQRVENQCGSGTIGIRTAYMAIASGLVDMAMVVGAEKMYTPTKEDIFTTMLAGFDREWEACFGINPVSMFAIMAKKHMGMYGTTEEQLAMISVKNHAHSTKNPFARFQEPVTIDQVMNSKPIAWPMKLYDASSNSDGAAAVILTSEERAKDLTDKPVYIIGTNQVNHAYTWANVERDLTTFPAAKLAAKNAYKMAGITADDLDFVELHDCFTISEIILTEEFGFCEKGEGGRFVEAGQSEYGGKVVVNPRGGLIGCGHALGATGVAQAVEAFLQLRGEAGERQVEGARIGMAHTASGVGEQHIVIYGKEPRS